MSKLYLGALLFWLAQTACAQQVAQTRSASDGESETVVVTATRFEQRNPSGTTVQIIDAREIEASGQRFLPDLLRTQAGVNVLDLTGTPDKQIDLRGFGVTGNQNVVVLIDGQRLSEHELNSATWSSIPVESIDRIEIVRGSASVLWGSGAVGGVINIITRKATPGQRGAQLSAAVGNYDTREARASGVVAGDAVGLTLALNRFATDNYRANNHVEEASGSVGIDTLGKGARASLRVAFDSQDGRLPGNRSRSELITDRRGTSTPDDFSNRDTLRLNLGGVIPVGSVEFRVDAGWRDRKTIAFLSGTNLDTRSTLQSLSPRLRIPFGPDGHAHAITLGVDWDRWDYDSDRFSFGQPFDITGKLENFAVYAQQISEFSGGTTLSLGGRLQRARSNVKDAASAQPYAAGEQKSNLKAYEFLLKQNLSDSTNIYAKIGQAFRIATLDEVYLPFGGPLFDATVNFTSPQISKDREIGLRAEGSKAGARLALFHIDTTDEIHFDPIIFRNINYPPSRRYGAELDLRWHPAAAWTLQSNASYTHARFRSGTVSGRNVAGKDVPLVPHLMANLMAQWDISERFSTNVGITWVGSQRFDNDESNTFVEKIPDYTTVDARMTYQHNHWAFAAEVRNLLNEHYFSYAASSTSNTNFNAYPAAERSFLITAQVRF